MAGSGAYLTDTPVGEPWASGETSEANPACGGEIPPRRVSTLGNVFMSALDVFTAAMSVALSRMLRCFNPARAEHRVNAFFYSTFLFSAQFRSVQFVMISSVVVGSV